MNNDPLHSVSVAGVTVDDGGRVLIIQRRDNAEWQIPGGVLELGESFEDGVARETLEETGVTVSPLRLTGVYKNVSIGVVALVYRCRWLTGSPAISNESTRAEWVEISTALSLMKPVFAIRVQDALVSNGAASRVHDGVRII